MKKNNNNKKSGYMLFIIILLFMATLLTLVQESTAQDPNEATYNEFLEMVDRGEIKEVVINLDESKFQFENNKEEVFLCDNPKTENFKEFLLLKNIKVTEVEPSQLVSILVSFIQIILYLAFFSWVLHKMTPGQKKDDLVEKVPDITFDDIAGAKELKKDLQFVIEYLKNPKKYEKMGARMPKGIILYGPPGTGKTLTAKAIAGTAGVPFFSMSGSDFVEMYVGLGAKRVRELYKKARAKAPCIVFIDEIDAIGGKRNSATTHSENTQTINSLLAELDGFNGSEGVLTICATNMLDTLDSALVRPGRFDKQLAVPMPDKDDRLAILKVHAKGKKFLETVDFEAVANMTVGFSGAGLESMLNEAAFLAVNANKEAIDMDDIDHAFYKLVMKGDKKENQNSRDKEELRLCAWHESAHALASKLYTTDSVPKVTILASTSGAGGTTFRNPKDMSLYSKNYLRGLIKVMYAGRAGEACYTGSQDLITTGASSDIKQATELIKSYISVYGMDEKYGLLNLEAFQNLDNSELINQASELSKSLYSEVETDIMSYTDVLKEMAEYLLANESMDEAILDEILKKHNVPVFGGEHFEETT